MSENAPTVLVVDDNRSIADTYAAFLDAEYDVRTAYTGQAALDVVGPDVSVVLLDRRMPGLSGDEVLQDIELRALDCRVVMITAVDPEFDIVDLPFDAYVVKPVGREELNEIVAEMVRRSNYEDDLRRFLALVSKQATLERERDSAALSTSEEYDRITERIAAQREELGVDTERLEAVVAGERGDIVQSVPGE